MIDSRTLDEWEMEVKEYAPKPMHWCPPGFYVARVGHLIEELRKLQEREAAFRSILEEIKYNASNHLDNSISSEWLIHVCKEVLARFPEEKKV